MDWEMLERTIRASHAYRTRQSSPDNRDAITDHIKAATQSVVLSGPFAGMRITDLSSRGDGDLAPKLLGTYEQDLHGVIAACATRRYDAIVDIGCAEGYYAVGLALLFPRTPVFAFDIDRNARDILMRNARLNACEDQIVVGEGCDPAALAALYRRYPRALVLCDCEWYEAQLFGDPQTNALGQRADLLIECHDAWDAAITPALIAALSPTHAIARIEQGARNPHAAACLADLGEWDRWRAIWERRGPAQHWLFCTPLAPDTMSSSRHADM